ncbi:site-specific integrase [Acetobacter thailandicus]|uniref:transposase n=1 Tax=Acetobacter thailandicus TaxID=1502842 RepID=UPI001BA522DC|nr:transposase [Acetobacter thailandicus]MBS0961371.1 transposase [Acetobacter thailandicus]
MTEIKRLLTAALPPQGLSDGTARTYTTSWRAFVQTQAPQQRFPIGEEVLTKWLERRARAGRPRKSLNIDRAAVVAWCAVNGETLKTLRFPENLRIRAKATSDLSANMLSEAARRCKPDIAGVRDRALLSLAAALSLGAEALARLQVEDFIETADGMTVSLLSPRSGRRTVKKLRRRREPAICPVCSWQAWRDGAHLRYGHAFRNVSRGGTPGAPLSVPGVRFVLERALGKISPPPKRKKTSRTFSILTRSSQQAERPAEGVCTDWIRTTVMVSGPGMVVERFEASARGPGTIPWYMDFDYEQARLLAPMASIGPQAAILARLLREASERLHHLGERRRASGDISCPFDLNHLLPVPDKVLEAGEDSTKALVWLQANWGTLKPLRHVSVRTVQDRRARRCLKMIYEFWSADWTPWQAFIHLRSEWPELVFDIRPHYDFADMTGEKDAL